MFCVLVYGLRIFVKLGFVAIMRVARARELVHYNEQETIFFSREVSKIWGGIPAPDCGTELSWYRAAVQFLYSRFLHLCDVMFVFWTRGEPSVLCFDATKLAV